ncbi:MAG: dihydropyrimidinase [Candidatus Rokubacteria bacterium]|nr:dihydropyrimidinase [Candidatus Rokubacteria bacterium]
MDKREAGPAQVDVVVRGGLVVDGAGMQKYDILIKDGTVVGRAAPGQKVEAKRVVDASGKLVLPGVIDAHNHPVYSDRIGTLSVSAALGGVTTVISFIGAIKAWGKTGSLLDAARDFIEEGEAGSVIDFCAHGSLVRDDLETIEETIPKLVELGVTSFKGFMAYSKRGMKLEDNDLLRVMRVIGAHGGLFCVHAENGTMLDYLQDTFIAAGRITPEYHALAQPNIAESEAVLRIAALASVVECPVYLVHLSARQSLDVVRMWRGWGGSIVYAETCTHYLTLSNADLLARGSLGKVGPPLREKGDVEALWEAIREGAIDVVASDFAGHTTKNKEPIWDDIFKAPAGLPGVGNLLTVVYDEGVNRGRITIPRLVELLCERPAKIFGLYPRKGALRPGSDADLVLFDPTVEHVIRASGQRLNTDYSMYEGRRCVGAPVLVMQRGRVIVEDGEVKASPGQGSYVPRASRKTA